MIAFPVELREEVRAELRGLLGWCKNAVICDYRWLYIFDRYLPGNAFGSQRGILLQLRNREVLLLQGPPHEAETHSNDPFSVRVLRCVSQDGRLPVSQVRQVIVFEVPSPLVHQLPLKLRLQRYTHQLGVHGKQWYDAQNWRRKKV